MHTPGQATPLSSGRTHAMGRGKRRTHVGGCRVTPEHYIECWWTSDPARTTEPCLEWTPYSGGFTPGGWGRPKMSAVLGDRAADRGRKLFLFAPEGHWSHRSVARYANAKAGSGVDVSVLLRQACRLEGLRRVRSRRARPPARPGQCDPGRARDTSMPLMRPRPRLMRNTTTWSPASMSCSISTVKSSSASAMSLHRKTPFAAW